MSMPAVAELFVGLEVAWCEDTVSDPDGGLVDWSPRGLGSFSSRMDKKHKFLVYEMTELSSGLRDPEVDN